MRVCKEKCRRILNINQENWFIFNPIFFFLCCKKRKKSGSCDIVNRRGEFHFWVNYPFKAEFTSPSSQLLGPNLSLIPCQRSHLTLYTGVRPMIQLGHNTSLIAQVSLHSPDQLSKWSFLQNTMSNGLWSKIKS